MQERERSLPMLNDAMMGLREGGEEKDAASLEKRIRA